MKISLQRNQNRTENSDWVAGVERSKPPENGRSGGELRSTPATLIIGEICLLFITSLMLTAEAANAVDRNTKVKTSVGRTVKDFTLKDYRGKTHKLSDYAKSETVVLCVIGTECPLVKLYTPRLQQLADEYSELGVTFIGINANRQDSITDMANHARIHGIKFPVLKDLKNVVADQIGATRTPEVFVLDKNRVIQYHGAIDDQYGIGTQRPKAENQYLVDAIAAVSKGKTPTVTHQDVIGCFIGRVRETSPNAKVTYSEHIAPILRDNCVECHRSGEIAPFELTQYDEVAGWADTIAEVVRDNRMPPWHANPEHGKFANERILTKQQKQLIYAWAAAGAPEGDSKKLPKPKTYLTGWQLPKKPDAIFDMRDKPFVVPAEAGPKGVAYQHFSVDPGFKEDKWVTAAEIIPGNRAVVHHIIVYVRAPNTSLGQTIGEGFLVAYVPGLRTKPLPEGMAKRIPKGSKFVFQVHYTPIGSEQTDLSKVGLIFADEKDVKEQVITTNTGNRRFRIPPHAENHKVESRSRSVDADVKLLSMSPHMHLRGKSFRYEAQYPDGKTEILLDVPAYDFNWQTAYRLEKPKTLPAGTRMQCTAYFDNSENNPWNPDPSITVTWGDQTWDEMMLGYFDIAIPKNIIEEQAETKTAQWAKRLIGSLDKDKNDKVDLEETPLKYKKWFNRLDKNNDGFIEQKEMEQLVKLLGVRN